MAETVCSDFFERSTPLDAAVETNQEVIAYVREITLEMPTTDICHMKILTCLGGGAVDDDFIDFPHDYLLYDRF